MRAATYAAAHAAAHAATNATANAVAGTFQVTRMLLQRHSKSTKAYR